MPKVKEIVEGEHRYPFVTKKEIWKPFAALCEAEGRDYRWVIEKLIVFFVESGGEIPKAQEGKR